MHILEIIHPMGIFDDLLINHRSHFNHIAHPEHNMYSRGSFRKSSGIPVELPGR